MLTFSVVAAPSNGSLELSPDGTFTYTPNPGFVGADTFDFAASDGPASTTATVTIDVYNTAPEANDRSESVLHGRVLQAFVSASDADGDMLTLTVVASPSNGSLDFNANGTFTYTPNPGFVGADTFDFAASDGPASTTARVTIDVYNTAPEAYNSTESVLHGRPLHSLVSGFDPDGDMLTFSVITSPGNGTLSFCGNGHYVYAPNPGFVGSDSFVFAASDGIATGSGTVTINVYNNGPVADDASETVRQDQTLHSSVTGSDMDGDILTFSMAVSPLSGTLTMNPDGTYSYAPNAGYFGSDSFQFTVNDGAASDTATVTIDVVPLPRVTITSGPVQVNEGHRFTVSGTSLAAHPEVQFDGPAWYDEYHTIDYVTGDWTVHFIALDVVGMGLSNTFSLTITVDDGIDTASDTIEVTVNNVAPQLSTIAAATIDEGEFVELAIEFVDIAPLYTISDTYVITVDWGDGTVETISDVSQFNAEIFGSDHPGYVRYTGIIQHQYLDDGPSPGNGTPTDDYTVTITITDDDAGTATASGIVTVNNVAPTVIVDSIEIHDAIIGTDPYTGQPIYLNPGQLDESEGFTIRGTITDPGVNDVQTATLELDLNFDGIISGPDEVVTLSLTPDPSIPGRWMFEHTIAVVRDDGPSPGNGTPSDDYTVTITVTDDDTGQFTSTLLQAVNNVAPVLTLDVMPFRVGRVGGVPRSITVSGSYSDVGTADTHTVTVEWADGHVQQNIPVSGGTFQVTRTLPTPPPDIATLAPVQVTVTDDDTLSDQETRNFPQVNATIHHGLHGAAVADGDEESVGAFTVANQNDTDGDGVMDYNDNDGHAFFDPNTGLAHGVTEDDLMRLVLDRPTIYGDGDVLEVFLRAGSAKFWEVYYKDNRPIAFDASSGDHFTVTFGPGEMSKEVWVEAPDPSIALRDIRIEYNYNGFVDTLRATAVWARLIEAVTTTEDASNFFGQLGRDPFWSIELADPTNQVTADVEALGGTGVRNPDPNHGVRNVILFAWDFFPRDINTISNVRFDVTRRIQVLNRQDGVTLNSSIPEYPTLLDEANDDARSTDECYPTILDQAMNMDGPGVPTLVANGTFFQQRMNAQEFVRVRFDGDTPVGNYLSGTRASGKLSWYTRLSLSNVNGSWVRDPFLNNDIATGQIVISQ
jgi:hypothetical protein